MNRVEEYRNLVKANTRAKFTEICPYPFLVGMPALSRPNQPGRTILVSQQDREALLASSRKRRPSTETTLVVLPIRKVQEAFASMITVGRTNNNDIVIEDVQVSKFHAFFRLSEDKLELADAGSRNGTFIGKIRLESKGAAQPVRQGETIRFGHLEFVLLESGSLWDRLH
jgi:hypothetical protein